MLAPKNHGLHFLDIIFPNFLIINVLTTFYIEKV